MLLGKLDAGCIRGAQCLKKFPVCMIGIPASCHGLGDSMQRHGPREARKLLMYPDLVTPMMKETKKMEALLPVDNRFQYASQRAEENLARNNTLPINVAARKRLPTRSYRNKVRVHKLGLSTDSTCTMNSPPAQPTPAPSR